MSAIGVRIPEKKASVVAAAAGFPSGTVSGTSPRRSNLKSSLTPYPITARPSSVTSDLYNQVSTAYFTAVNEILTGQAADAAARVAQLAEELKGIVAQL